MTSADSCLVKALEKFMLGARADLLHALTSPANVLAERICLWFEGPDTRDLGKLLIDLETDDFAWAAVVEALRRMGRGD